MPHLAAKASFAERETEGKNTWTNLGPSSLQRGETQSVWHWGANFPGYQALAVADRQSGDIVMILLNGGALSFSPSGLRYSGLEGAREVIADLLGDVHGAYWKDIQ